MFTQSAHRSFARAPAIERLRACYRADAHLVKIPTLALSGTLVKGRAIQHSANADFQSKIFHFVYPRRSLFSAGIASSYP